MAKRIQGFIIGVVFCILASGGVAFAANQNLEATYNNIKIVVDGKEIHPTDANGNAVEPFIVNGTTYLPVRAVAGALGKAVYWDGPNYTVYLGNMNGKLEYPSLRIDQATIITGGVNKASKNQDNYENTYAYSHFLKDYQTLLNMKYSRFKGTLYVQNGENSNMTATVSIEVDGRIVYTSPEFSKISAPVNFEVDITGGNDFKIFYNENNNRISRPSLIVFGDAGFYQ